MIRCLFTLIVFVIGCVSGAFVCYVSFHSKVTHSNDASELILKIMNYSELEIAEENYSCEGSGIKKLVVSWLLLLVVA